MKIFAYTQEEESEAQPLNDIMLTAEPETLRELASFLYRCADTIEEKPQEFEQEQFESSEHAVPGIFVFNPRLLSE